MNKQAPVISNTRIAWITMGFLILGFYALVLLPKKK